MSKPDAPGTPDYRGAAEAQAASQRVNYQSPWGSINWTPPQGAAGSQGPTGFNPGNGTFSMPANQGTSSTTNPPQGTGSRTQPQYSGDGDSVGGGEAGPGAGGPVGGPAGESGPGSGAGDPAASGGDGSIGSGPGGAGGPTGGGGPGSAPPPGGTGGPDYSLMPWTQTLTLAPEQQALLDAQNRTSLGLAGLQGQGVDAVRGVFNNMPSRDQLPAAAVNPGQTGQDAIMARVQPMLNRQQDRLNNQLANQGIQVGSEAWQQAQRDFGEQQNDAYSQAALHGIDLTQQARNQAMGEQGFYSQLPINLLNAVRQGSQVQTPQGGSAGPGANYLGAAQLAGNQAMGQYGAQTAAYNQQMGTLASLAAAYMMSDRRLKTNIERVGTHPSGVGIYDYDIFGKRQRGVMADEVQRVMPDAVKTHESGFLMVDYGRL